MHTPACRHAHLYTIKNKKNVPIKNRAQVPSRMQFSLTLSVLASLIYTKPSNWVYDSLRMSLLLSENSRFQSNCFVNLEVQLDRSSFCFTLLKSKFRIYIGSSRQSCPACPVNGHEEMRKVVAPVRKLCHRFLQFFRGLFSQPDRQVCLVCIYYSKPE